MQNETNITTLNYDIQKPFCLSCGFNFGHIVNGVDDTTMGILLVVSLMLVVAIFSCCSCYCYYKYYPSQKEKNSINKPLVDKKTYRRTSSDDGDDRKKRDNTRGEADDEDD